VLTACLKSTIFSAEFTHWKSVWYLSERQTLNFMDAGASFEW
jgi:hypothetical protein